MLAELFPHGRPERLVALVGNPNVGESTIFNHVTGQDVLTAHYPGKSPDINVGTTQVGEHELTVMDLPGAYSIGGAPEEQWVARRALLDMRPDVVVVVLDASNITRNLAIALQVLDMALPTVIAVNLVDEAERSGVTVDTELLAALLGAVVIKTVATSGIGVEDLMEAAAHRAGDHSPPELPRHSYGDMFEAAMRPLVETVKLAGVAPYGLPPRSTALQIIEGFKDIENRLAEAGQTGMIRVAEEARAALASMSGEPPFTALARERHGAAGLLAERVLGTVPAHKPGLQSRLLGLTTRARTGIPLLLVVLLSVFGLLFVVGGALAAGFSALWGAYASPLIQGAVHALAGDGAFARTLLWGLDAGLEAALGIGLPYILTFYVLLSLLEDTGYLNAVAFLSDTTMHNIGLHGRATIPLVAGAGCSVPAVLSVRVLPTDRERFLAATLVSFVPCSARTAVILGAVGAYVGWAPALGVYAVTLAVISIVGVLMDRLVPGASGGFVMEMFPFRRPAIGVVLRKSWSQFREFLVVATPLVVVGSMVLGGLYETGWLFKLTGPLEPVVGGWLGLPAFAGLTLLLGLLRKEFALQLLVALAVATGAGGGDAGADLLAFMTVGQIFVYTLVNTLAMPCVSTVAVLGRVLGWKRAAGVLAVTVSVALLVGGLFARLLPALGVA
jgi:ferrous iron transport protein B